MTGQQTDAVWSALTDAASEIARLRAALREIKRRSTAVPDGTDEDRQYDLSRINLARTALGADAAANRPDAPAAAAA